MSELLQVLSGDAAAVDCEGLGLKQTDLERLYEAMVTTRTADERSRRLHEEGEISFYVASRGLEAVACGAASALETADWLFPSQRDLGMYLLRGGSLRSWFDQLFGNAADLAKGRQLPGHPSLPDGRHVAVSGRVGTQIAHASGCAMAMHARGAQACALASFGQAAVGGSDFHAAMTVAARFRAPAVFLCRAEQREVSAEVGVATTPAQRARGYGVASVRVDGSDALAVFQAVREARESALQGGGATLIEAVVTRAALFGEAGEGDDKGSAAAQDDPVARLRTFMEEAGYWDAARDDELAARSRERVEQAGEAARAEAGAPIAAMFDDVYAELPWMLQEQRERLLGGSDD